MENTLERNIGYVVSVVGEHEGEYDIFELTKATRLKHGTENPLGLKDARDAIQKAEQRGLIQGRKSQDQVAIMKKQFLGKETSTTYFLAEQN